MRMLAVISGGVVLAAAIPQAVVPAPLARNYAALAAAPSLTAVYTVRKVGESPYAYKLELSHPGLFRLSTPSGFVVSDGKTVTTYTAGSKSYKQEPYTDAWAASFATRPEVAPWGAFLLKKPAADLLSAKVGAARTVSGAPTTEVVVTPKKGLPTTLFLDKKLGVARGALVKTTDGETLVTATSVEIGKAPMGSENFAFVAPDGAKNEADVAPAVTFAQVNAVVQDRCMPCHSATNHRGGYDLSTYDGVKATTIPGDAAGSLIVKAVTGAGVKKMPLGNHPAYSEAEVKQLSDWIAAGAKND